MMRLIQVSIGGRWVLSHCSACRHAGLANRTWTGSSDTNWLTPGNWDGATSAPAATDSLVFDGTNNLSNNNNFAAATQFKRTSLLTRTRAPLCSSGSAINLGGDVITAHDRPRRSTSPMAMTAARNFQHPGRRHPEAGRQRQRAFAVTFQQAHDQHGTVILGAVNGYHRGTTVSAARLKLGIANAIGTGGALTLSARRPSTWPVSARPSAY